ncbi:ABC transporter permease [Sphingomicrobium astaxanthinifaciens]|uniref:ABC transporter permease n=1 Tax=Sphingomicrobium astaxanthinifaciens TaxID=1227949 RepID=UPI001FCB3ECA|nr:ABC transporter permease [Sphingomicrobium astaxanthinifaciens]MCJ7420974.1 ABC transporter permease [Sphingomicrobium astaxanthinifaciens]
MRELLRAAWVIGRRDYIATVLSKTFLFFLIGPLFPVAIGVLFAGVGSNIADREVDRIVAVVASEEDMAALEAARERLAPLAPGGGFVMLERVAPAPDAAAQREALLGRTERPILGVLEGGLEAPRFTGTLDERSASVRQLVAFIDDARRAEAVGGLPDATGPALAVETRRRSASSVSFARQITARMGQLLLFFITILLAGMLLSQMLEEKSNKAIEVLASAVPVDSIFIGKLFAMLAISLTGIIVWIATILAALYIWGGGDFSLVPPPPAVGWPVFLLLGLVYFATSYLLLGAAFLGIGAQASTVRQVQTLSMPITMVQVVIFLGAQLGVGEPEGAKAIAAAIFPFTSPFAMIARAAEVEALWPHLLAVLWQALWVALILKFAASIFRKSVLKSGKPFRWPWRRRAAR